MSAELLVYVHFPYCLEKCPYCDFVSFKVVREDIDHARYADLVVTELDHRARALEALGDVPRLRSIFLGGGTPSLWAPSEVARVLGAIRARLPGDDVEVTAECNPTSLDDARREGLREAGVSRFSIGVQSLDDARLAFLGRMHDGRTARAVVASAVRSGARVSADLIHGVHGQSAEEAAREVNELLDLGVGHLSSYSLTIESGTRFGELARRNRLPLLGDDEVVRSQEAVSRATTARGLVHYEISNHARPGEESRHNLGYWRGHAYLGLGCAAVGALPTKEGFARYRNAATPEAYAASIGGQGVTPESVEPLDAETRLRERIMLGLRLAEGLDLGEAGRALGVDPWTPARTAAIEKLGRRGLLSREGDRLVVPREAWRLADGVAAEVM